eukprot:PITA_03586
MEKLPKGTEEFVWNEDYQTTLNKLKERLVSAPILVYPDWNKMFHVHIDASGIALGAVLVQPGEKNVDNLVYYASRELSTAKRNYTKTEREALAMVYYLQNLGVTCWEFTFKVVIKPNRLNVWPDHLSQLETGENEGAVDDQLPCADLFRIEAIPDHLEEITTLLTLSHCQEGYTATQRCHLVVRAADYQLIAGHLYKMGFDQILRRCILQHEISDVLCECHARVAVGHGWKAFATDELPLNPVHRVKIFDKWEIDFIGPITPPARHSRARYIITTTEYLTRWVEEAPIKDYTAETTTRFIFENIISRLGCSRNLTSDQGTHFLNETIETLLKTFMIHHNKSSPYHPQANGAVEAFNKILEKALRKVVSANKDD